MPCHGDSRNFVYKTTNNDAFELWCPALPVLFLHLAPCREAIEEAVEGVVGGDGPDLGAVADGVGAAADAIGGVVGAVQGVAGFFGVGGEEDE